jgi:hypothetical protein
MRVNLFAVCVTLIAVAGIAGCGGYSSSKSPTAPDSTSDSTARPPSYNYK